MNTAKNKPVSKQALYSMVSSHAKGVIKRLVELTKSNNESVALGACKILLNKTLPDTYAVDLDDTIASQNQPIEPTTLTPEEARHKAERLILCAQALTNRGRYRPRDIGAQV